MDFKLTDNSEQVLEALASQVIKALTECGGAAEGYAKGLCPVDTGNLRNSISYQVDTTENACYIGTNVEYAPYVEFGTGIYYSGGRQTSWRYQNTNGDWVTTHGSPAQPYLKPAVSDHSSQFQELILNALKK